MPPPRLCARPRSSSSATSAFEHANKELLCEVLAWSAGEPDFKPEPDGLRQNEIHHAKRFHSLSAPHNSRTDAQPRCRGRARPKASRKDDVFGYCLAECWSSYPFNLGSCTFRNARGIRNSPESSNTCSGATQVYFSSAPARAGSVFPDGSLLNVKLRAVHGNHLRSGRGGGCSSRAALGARFAANARSSCEPYFKYSAGSRVRRLHPHRRPYFRSLL
jgi:hypothetical protein